MLNDMIRRQIITRSCGWLALALVVVSTYAFKWNPAVELLSIHDCGCDATLSDAAVQHDLPAGFERESGTRAPTPLECDTCFFVGSVTQLWCKLRLTGQDCSGMIPAWDNFEFERLVKYYQCAENQLATCCTVWEDSGCCNNSYDPPPCTDPEWGNQLCHGCVP